MLSVLKSVVVSGVGVVSQVNWKLGRQWAVCPTFQGGGNVSAPQLTQWTNQIPLLVLRLDYFNIASRRKFHLAFLPFFFRSKSIHEDATTVASLPTAACCLFSLRRILRRLTLLD